MACAVCMRMPSGKYENCTYLYLTTEQQKNCQVDPLPVAWKKDKKKIEQLPRLNIICRGMQYPLHGVPFGHVLTKFWWEFKTFRMSQHSKPVPDKSPKFRIQDVAGPYWWWFSQLDSWRDDLKTCYSHIAWRPQFIDASFLFGHTATG